MTPMLLWCTALSNIHSYKKVKHSSSPASRLMALFVKIRQLVRFRLLRYDLILYVGDGSSPYGLWIVGLIRPTSALAFTSGSARILGVLKLIHSPMTGRLAEYREILKLAEALGIPQPFSWPVPLLQPPALVYYPSRPPRGLDSERRRLGIHLSARRSLQKWPIENFRSLITQLVARLEKIEILVTWSPGATGDKLHPGDDGLADELMKSTPSNLIGHSVIFAATPTLHDLLIEQSSCDVVFCSDGGAMHLAAALGKNVVAMFGDSDHIRWRPIGEHHRVLLAENRDVRGIIVDRVVREICSALSYDHSQ